MCNSNPFEIFVYHLKTSPLEVWDFGTLLHFFGGKGWGAYFQKGTMQ